MRLHSLPSRFFLMLLALCFTLSTAAAGQTCFSVQKPAQAEAMMDCHKAAQDTTQKTEKNCCQDFSCPKCFSAPPATTARLGLSDWQASMRISSFAHTLFHYFPDTPQRPPKTA
ncbi:MAG: hypothetical protein SFX19_07005 [Alphaproteobacteria bacterium]|nr:hypothetical protein [Alphaproteobacteria bacterium]